MKNIFLYLGLILSLLASSFDALANQCNDIYTDIFTHGLASHSGSGKVTFESKSQILSYVHSTNSYYYPSSYPSRNIDFKTRTDNTKDDHPKSCGDKRCKKTNKKTASLNQLGDFQSSNSSDDRQINTEVTLPAGDYGNIQVRNHGVLTLSGGNGIFRIKNLDVEQGGEIHFSGGVYFIEKLHIKYQAKAFHHDGGTALLYVNTTAVMDSESRFNRFKRASNFLLFANGNVSFNYSSQSRMFVYSKSEVNVEQNAFLKGAVNAKTVHMKYQSTLYWDLEATFELDRCSSGVDQSGEATLVGHWNANVCGLNGTPGEVVDVVGGNNGQSVAGASIATDGKFCQALRFNGENANVLIPHNNDFALASGSVAFWFKTNDLSHSNNRGYGGQGLWSKDSSGWDEGGDHLTIWLKNDGAIRVRHQNDQGSDDDISLVSESYAVQANQWHHLVYTWGAEGSYLYVDGEGEEHRQASGGDDDDDGGDDDDDGGDDDDDGGDDDDDGGDDDDDNDSGNSDYSSEIRSLANNPEPIVLGANAWTSENYGSSTNLKDHFKGQIDDVRLYSGQLDLDEVEALYEMNNPDTCVDCPVTEPELVAQYSADLCDFNGDGGTYVDSVNGYNGFHYNGVEKRSGRFCDSVYFSGEDEYISIPHVQDFNISQGAIAMWVFVPELTFENKDGGSHSGQTLFSKDSQGYDNGGKHLSMWVQSDGSVRVRHQTTNDNNLYNVNSAPGAINQGQWQHIMYTWGENGKRLYIDGSLASNLDGFSPGIETNPEPIILGASATLTGNSVSEEDKLGSWFKGKLDDVRIYGSAQPDDDFVASVAEEDIVCSQCVEPMAHYQFEGSSAAAFNSSTGRFNGNDFPEGNSGITFLYGAGNSSTIGSCQAMSIPDNGNDDGIGDVDPNDEGVAIRQAMDSGIDPDDIGIKGTISFWYQANENWGEGGPRQLFDGSDQSHGGGGSSKYFHGTMLSNGKIRFGMEDSNDGDGRIDTTASFTFAAGTWVHLAFVWDFTNASSNTDADMRIFVNGVEQPFNYVNNSINTPGINFQSTIFFGDNRMDQYHVGLSTGNSANGQFDDIRVYDVALDSSRMQQDMADVSPCRFEVSRYQLEFPASAGACSATDITVKACEDANCQNTASGTQQVWVSYEYADGETESVAEGFTLNNGTGTLSFTPKKSGTGTFKITQQSPAPQLGYICNQPNCQINYNAAALQIDYLVGGVSSDAIPVETAEQAFSQSNAGSLVLETPGSCQLPVNAPVEIAVECVDPAVCSGNKLNIVADNGNLVPVTPVNQLPSGGTIPDNSFVTYSDVFNGTQLSLDNMLFNDAGEIKLHVKVAGQTVTQNIYVVPQYLELSSSIHPELPSQETVNVAGDNFTMTVTARGANGGILPNYTAGQLEFALERITPETVNGSNTSLYITNPTDSNEVLNISDNSELTQFDGNSFATAPGFADGVAGPMVTYIPEVGRFAVDIQDANYLGKGGEVGVIPSKLLFDDVRDDNNQLILDNFVFSRFKPAKFSLRATVDYSPYCGNFTFRGDVIEADGDGTPHILEFTALNSRDQITRYYDADTGSVSSGIPSESEFIAGQAFTLAYTGTASGKKGTGLRVDSMGLYTASSGSRYSVWRVINRESFSQQVRLDYYGASWETTLDVAGNGQTFVASPLQSGTIKLYLGALDVDTKATNTSGNYSLPTSGNVIASGQTGGSFKFDLSGSLFASRAYSAVTAQSGENGTSYAAYPHVTAPPKETNFVNGTLGDGIFEFHFASDDVTFNKYFGLDSNGNEFAQPAIVNGTGIGDVSVRLNIPASSLKDSDNVSVVLSSIVETTGKTVLVTGNAGAEVVLIDNLLDGIELRSGRIRLVNSVTAELDTEVGIVSEYYAGNNNWQVNELDSCIAYDSANLAIRYVENTIAGTPTLANSGVFDKGIGDGADAMTIGIGGFTGENNSGEVDLGYKIPADLNYLQYYWCGANSLSTSHQNNSDNNNPNSTPVESVSCLNPIGQYTFGLERGNDRVIHWREVLR